MDVRAIIMGVTFAFIWSSAFTSARIIVADASPLFALAVRFLISGGIGVAIALALGQSWRLTRNQWRATIIFGICQNALYLGLNFVAMQTIEAGLAAIVASSLPLLVAVAAWLFLGQRPSFLGAVGLVTGFAGVALIMGSRLTMGVDPVGLGLCVIGVMSLTFATMILRNASSGGNFLMVIGLQMLVGSVVLTAAAFMFEDFRLDPSWKLAAAFGYTVFVPGLLATLVWFNLVHRVGTVKASTFHFLNPFIGVATAAIILSEVLGLQDVIGVAIITFGILAVQLSKQA